MPDTSKPETTPELTPDPETTPNLTPDEPLQSMDVESSPVRPRFKLPKGSRLPADGPYKRVFQARRTVSNELISLHVLPNGLTRHRLGFGVAKKMFRKAVARNRIKRLIREAFRLERHGFGSGLDIVVRPKVTQFSLIQLQKSLRYLVPKAEQRFLPKASEPDRQLG